MDILLSIVAMTIVLGITLYHRMSLVKSVSLLTAAMLVLTIAGSAGFIGWAIYILAIAVFAVSGIRQSLISRKALAVFKKVLPAMSQTEKEALDAGTVWWEAELFKGKPEWKKLHAIQAPKLSAEEQAFLDGPVNEVCAMVNDFQVTHELADLPPEVWQYLKDHKFFAMIIKKKYGGLEFSAYAQSLVLQKLTGVSGVLSSTVGVPNSLGPGELLQHYGTEEQKDYYLPRLAEGKEIPCFALTSPEAGSDAGSIPDYGVVCKGQWEGKEVLGMRLTWNKRYITLAPVATVLGLAFKLRDPQGLLGDKEDLGITCALIPTNVKGVEIGNRHFPLNVPFQNGPTRGKDIFVPIDFIIGGEKMAGQGWRMLVECLSVGRGITLPSNSTGGIKTAALATGAYSRIRRQFKQPIGHMEGIEEPLARIGGNAYVMDAASNLTVAGIDLGEKPSVISAIVKYHCTHRGQQSIIDAMDIVGGKGICIGPSNFLARGYQGSPIAVTVEGANILTRSMIIFGQGAIRCHPYVLEEMNAAYSDASDAVEKFDKALAGHVSFTMSNLVRSIWFGLSDGLGSSAPTKDATKRYYQQLNRYSANLALLSDISMAVLGGSLKRKERLSARLGDILSQLYLSSAALKRFEQDGRPVEDLPLVHWALQDSLKQAETAVDEFLANFPNKVIARTLRVLIMPFGRVRKAPSDKLDSKVARILQTPSATRSRIGRGQYLAPTEHNPAGKIELALSVILQAEPVFDKVCKAQGKRRPFLRLDMIAEEGLEQGIISQEEAELLREAEQHRLDTINVDDFEPEQLAAKPNYPHMDSVA
ncbi:acyl-CoA dehydrogenase FadE [Vibrio natriegens]|uniref:Acyl-coenzyme A dehydrogenase n=1 Tax=Vibrio natriegens NBRC 15636 = ATCC 14048 = DSM 759 TaxID=1219067 RepID=A0AAN1CW39_VIBNA|nr:acyl-CoA dehydrogenase FadE [Vibrio natriegens]ALR14884.1 acyl-CoA dehydrogenase [Vibrio natriegens NBRC 15636 = ATCC 14048 = DSM 759]ANQ13252.1 acyl-CoA dehydrogenase [Vibrio natriegens NBRC 15636 = ATCC 14048 = DSM 759]EPM39902.1 acyl-CoA dehydrogenase [Vibrio natriegens NBRC 15636 = ATCC 14048 = DSM 759]MDX6027682.1 acyl-CoA dehydrogenase FadE [Vibrio natriegens NBRC 15636 = ATCC 14048 = DSM 759]UUI10992.1 acyl-CoA dehydrogenase FadE [Vibrio natriegens]